jgi:hypothetical protein
MGIETLSVTASTAVGRSAASGNANIFPSQELESAVAQIRLTELRHFSAVRRKIASAADAKRTSHGLSYAFHSR